MVRQIILQVLWFFSRQARRQQGRGGMPRFPIPSVLHRGCDAGSARGTQAMPGTRTVTRGGAVRRERRRRQCEARDRRSPREGASMARMVVSEAAELAVSARRRYCLRSSVSRSASRTSASGLPACGSLAADHRLRLPETRHGKSPSKRERKGFLKPRPARKPIVPDRTRSLVYSIESQSGAELNSDRRRPSSPSKRLRVVIAVACFALPAPPFSAHCSAPRHRPSPRHRLRPRVRSLRHHLGATPTEWETGGIPPRPCACAPAGRKTTKPARMIWRDHSLHL